MPWRETDVLELRRQFISRWQLGDESISELCEEFGVSRKTGHKWLKRFKQGGSEGLRDQHRRPRCFKDELPKEILCEVIRIRNWRPLWGGRKIRQYLDANADFERLPHSRTIDRYLKRCGYAKPRKADRGRGAYCPERLVEPAEPNDVWTADFKGWWSTQDGNRCEPLTVRDKLSRFVLNLSAHPGTSFEATKDRFSVIFEEFGLPYVMRFDNGSPFACISALHRLTRFAVWLMKHGVIPNRMDPASPHQNGAHERFHVDIKRELQNSPAANLAEEQKRFDVWRWDFNCVRPHEALGGKTPSELYRRSPRRYLGERIVFEYPPDFALRKVNANGEFNWNNKRVNFAKSLAGEYIGVEDDGTPDLNVWFCDFCLASLERNGSRIRPSQALSRQEVGRRT